MRQLRMIADDRIVSEDDYRNMHPEAMFAKVFAPLPDAELLPDAGDLDAEKAVLVETVDSHIAGIYFRWMRFDAAYVAREAAARAFVAAGYEGDAGVWITAFSTNAVMSDAQAADLIITQADALHTALEKLDALRMRKYAIKAATTAEAAQAERDDIITQANLIAAGL